MATLIPSSRDEGGKRHAAAGRDPAEPGTSQQVRVLIVEDEWLVSVEIETTLESAGYTVAGIAVSADEALRRAESDRPDVIVMDIRLRGRRDGVDAALQINQLLGLRCLFVSAYTDDRTRERARAAKPLGWLSKPFTPRQLLDALRAALRDLRH